MRLLPEDRPAIEAFMRGVEATEKLKFGHPGLATTATRTGGRLTIQNDIGETDAHVVVIAVEADAVTVTYTDVHLARAKFFTGLFRNFPVQWSGLERKSAPVLATTAPSISSPAACRSTTASGRDAFLETLGASLVFLIDWNKARKMLREWVSKRMRCAFWTGRHAIASATAAFSNWAAASWWPRRSIMPPRRGSASASGWTVRSAATRPSIFSNGFAHLDRRLAAGQFGAAGEGPHRGGFGGAFATRRPDADGGQSSARPAWRAKSRPEITTFRRRAESAADRSTAQPWPSKPAASRKKPIASRSRRAARSPGSTPTATSNSW